MNDWIPLSLADEEKTWSGSGKEWTVALALIALGSFTAWYLMPRNIVREAPKWSWPILIPLSLWPGFVAVVFGGMALSVLVLVVTGRFIYALCSGYPRED